MQVDANSLLHAALSEDNERAVRFLLKHGADPNARSRPTGEALRPFQRLGLDLEPPGRGRSNSLILRPTNPMVPIPTCGASTLGRGAARISRVSWSSSLELASAKYPTPLHVAAAGGKLALAELLLAAGAELDARMEGEFTPLAVAVLSRQPEVARLLLTCGANVHAVARRGKLPLHFAVRSRRVDLVKLLLEHRADPNATTQHGVTALHVAVERKLPEIVDLLLRSGAHVNARTNTGVTPLHCAASKGHRQITEMILNYGADVSVIVRKGEIDVAPLLWVTEAEKRKVTEILSKYVAKSSPAGFYGRFLKKIWRQISGKK